MINEGDCFYYQELLRVIKRISDISYQKRIWVKGEGPECSSFSETIDDFFESYEAARGLDINYKEPKLLP